MQMEKKKVHAEGQGSLRQTIMYGQHSFNEQNNGKQKLK